MRMKIEDIKKAYWQEAENYPGAALTRKELANLSGYSVGHLANLDSKGKGPECAFFRRGQRMYLKKPAVEWVINNLRLRF